MPIEHAEPAHTPIDLLDQSAVMGVRRVDTTRILNGGREIPFMQRPSCTIREACQAAGMGRTKCYELIKTGKLKITSVGRRRLVQVPSLLKLLNVDLNVPGEGPR